MDAAGGVGEEDAVAHDADCAKEDAEEAALLGAVGQEGGGHVGGGAEEVARDGEQLDLGGCPFAEVADDGGQEGGEAVEHGVDAELGEGEGPDLPVAKGAEHVGAAELAARGRRAVLPAPAGFHEGALGRGEEVGSLGVVGEGEVGDDAEEGAGDALYDQDPAPAAHARQAVHVADAVGQQPAQRARDGGAHEQVADPQGQLVLGVEEGEVDVEAREQTRLEGAQKQPAGEQARVRLDQPHAGGDDAPADGDEGDPAARREELEYEVRRHLKEEVGDEEDRHRHLELRGGEAKVRLEAVQARVADVDAVQEAEEVEAHDEWDKVEVQLAHEPLLVGHGGGAVVVVVVV